MATKWVGAGGDDGNDGTTYGLRKLTMASAITAAASTGDIINVVGDDGPLTITGTSTITNHSGTSYANFGLKIRGVDATAASPTSEGLALAELRFVNDISNQTMFSLSSTGTPSWTIYQALHCNWEAGSVGKNGKHFFDRGFITNVNHFIEYCKFSYDENFHGNIWNDPLPASSNASEIGELRYNYIVDSGASSSQLMRFYQRGHVEVHHNVWFCSGAWAHAMLFVDLQNNDGNVTDHRVYNNTIFLTTDLTGFGGFWASSDGNGPASGVSVKHLHSNVFGSATTQQIKYGIGSSSAVGVEGSYTRVIGWTLFWLPNATFPAYGYYQIPWDEDATDGTPEAQDEWSTDVIASSDPFADSSTAWTWSNINGSGLDMELAGDFRITDPTHRTMAQDGGVPGAISESPVEIDGSDISITANINSPVSGNVTISNIGAGTLEITNVVLDAVDDAGGTLTYSGATTASIVGGGSTTFPVVFTPTSHPTTATATLTFTNNDADESTFVINITGNSVQFGVPGDLPARPITPETPGYFLSPDNSPGNPNSGIQVRLQLRRNLDIYGNFHYLVGGNTELSTKIVVGTINIATNTASAQIPGISTTGISKLMIMPDGDTTVLLDAHTQLIKAGGCLLIAGAAGMDAIEMTNPSLVRPLTVTFFGSK